MATAEAPDPDALDWKPVWIHEFVAWCAERDLPVDFLTTHLYPTDYAFDAAGKGTPIQRHVDATRDDLVVMQELIAASPYPDAELHITEWSSSPSSRDAMHDTLFAAAYIVRAFLNAAPLADSVSYWTFTDVFEEGGGGVGPFHGGFGLVNEQGIHKPTFHAMAMLARLGDRLLFETPHGVLTRSSADGRVAGVFFNYPEDMGRRGVGSELTYAATRHLAQVGPARRVRHTVEGLPPGAEFTVEALDWDHGNVTEAWHRMGAPLNLTRAQAAELREVADGLARTVLTASDDGVLEIDLELAPWAVVSLVQVPPR